MLKNPLAVVSQPEEFNANLVIFQNTPPFRKRTPPLSRDPSRQRGSV
jgi:hypothetical protein